MDNKPSDTSGASPLDTTEQNTFNGSLDSPSVDSPEHPQYETQPVQPKKKSKRWLWIIPIVILVLALGFTAWYVTTMSKDKPEDVVSAEPKVRIGLSLDGYQESRWEKDREYIEARAMELDATLTTFIADGNSELQVSQIENLISQRVDVLMVVPHSADAIAPVLAKAKEAGIKILSYDRLILNADIDVYVSFDNEQVGKNSAQYVVDAVASKPVAKIAYVGGAPTDNNATLIRNGAMGILEPLIDSGKVDLVYDEPTLNWKPDLAYASFKAYLDKGNTVDGVIAANDGTAFGAIRALQESGLSNVPVTGQDAEIDAVKRLIAGTQLMTNYKSIKSLAAKAVEIAIDMAHGKEVAQNATIDNGFKGVASYLLVPVPVTKANIDDTVIKDGFFTRTQVYGRE